MESFIYTIELDFRHCLIDEGERNLSLIHGFISASKLINSFIIGGNYFLSIVKLMLSDSLHEQSCGNPELNFGIIAAIKSTN